MALDLSGGLADRLPGSRILVWCGGDRARVAGLDPWRRAVYTACRAGFERLLIVVDGDAAGVRRELSDDPRLADRCWEVADARERWDARLAEAGGRWVCLDDRWIVDSAHLRELARTRGELASAAPDGPVAGDAADLAALVAEGWTPPARRSSSGQPIDPPSVYVRAPSAGDAATAENALFASLARNTTNFFARTVDRAMSRAISRRLAPYPITPNQITIFSIGIGVIGALCLLRPTYRFGLLGSFLFLASTIIDGCDGEIARLKFQESASGAKLDIVGDNVVHAFLFPCVALHAYFGDPQGPYLRLGGAALAGVLLTWVVVYALVVRGQPSRRLLWFFELFGNREFAYLLFLLGLVGKLHWFVWGMAIGLWVFPLGLLALRWAER